MARVGPRGVLLAGLGLMVLASLVAPAQPELFPDGAACEIAPCGTLEDPPRWALAWVVWGLGLVAAAGAAAVGSGPLRPRASRLLLGLALAPLWLVALGVGAFIASLASSAQGGWTVLAAGTVLPLVWLLSGLVRGLHQDSPSERAVA